ncbi:nuclear transport factor 2 family protein [Sphingomonas sp. CGMCC 1.13654]|uniref:Nuclear transport factor 2 family protein n=1 Tax=Sphingomonas chungangi TaxID=2683589 RepID=A0A838L5L2_9SPHN|nr:nuclear transport factor 2 family protein [Sphingomonas chungangi]MBA2933749.1 nuclear transport factor 2 family protein [Sphingomonas chungangi]MVW55080.1 nuclear transport factor 2 family protein [Sphingomonas chungangi]
MTTDPLQRLIAIEEIKALKARYFRCVDTKDWAGLETVFAPDIVFDRTYSRSTRDPWTGDWSPPPPSPPWLVHGREAVMAMVRAAIEHLRTVHHGHMPEIDVIDESHATGIWAMSDELRAPDGTLLLAGRGHYHETYIRLADGWAIASSGIHRLEILRGPDPAATKGEQ